jgi:hypothetical protein
VALADYAALLAALDAPRQRALWYRDGTGSIGLRLFSYWINNPAAFVGVAPTTAVVPVRDTAGGNPYEASAGATQRILSARIGHGTTHGMLYIVDRLCHQAGLSGTSTSAQTTNLPTAALTRYTSGAGVRAGIEIYSALGATSVGLSTSYTNQAGTAGQVSPKIPVGNTNFLEARRFFDLPLQEGDTGVRSVESVTLDASTGSVGNFGVVLYKPLLAIPVDELRRNPTTFDGLLQYGGMFPEVVDGACLAFLARVNNNGIAPLLDVAMAET